MPPRKRGRGGKRGRPSTEPADPAVKVKCLSFPVTERDEESVECKLCGHQSTFREFRIHNIEVHYNISITTDDTTTIRDHRFYARKLQEMAKLAKISSFTCPTTDCTVKYKSALGLAFHLETCGKSEEEIAACMVECDVCHEKFSSPNLNWHKKSHATSATVDATTIHDTEGKAGHRDTGNKRKSAIKAREVMQQVADGTCEDAGEGSTKRKSKPGKKDGDAEWTGDKSSLEVVDSVPECSEPSYPDINAKATQFLDRSVTDESAVWDTPVRNTVDPFNGLTDNVLQAYDSEDIARQYLPEMTESVEFRTKVQQPSRPLSYVTTEFHRLGRFSAEMVDSINGNVVVHTGGPVTSVAWHPCGNLLATTSLKNFNEKPNLINFMKRKSSIQIYRHISQVGNGDEQLPINRLTIELILGMDFGYINHLQWSSFWPPFNITDDFKRFGFLACACEDSTCRILSIRKTDFELESNFISNQNSKIRVYKKYPEICLKIDKSAKLHTGQCVKFDWHENNRFFVAGYASGLVALFDLETESKLLREVIENDSGEKVVINPFWTFRAHLLAVAGIHFDPSNPRYFCTAGKDRLLKVWDVDLRMEIESKKVGMVIDTCWIRGWIHVAVAVDVASSNLSSQYNFVRFYQLGTMQGRPNCAAIFNITSLTNYNGMTVQGTEHGRVTVTYFDQFWRECDYDRNKKKKNVADLSTIVLDEDSFEALGKKHENKDGSLTIPYAEPRVIISFIRDRLLTHHLEEPSYQYTENFYRFYKYLRINKVAWCPTGEHFAVGYRNGLLTLIPANFEKIYSYM